MKLRISSLLGVIFFWKVLYSSSHIYKTTANGIEVNRVEANHLHVRTIDSVHSYPGQTLELQCTDDDEEVTLWWQTPFGLFEGCNLHSKDPVQTCNGSLRISKVTTSHDGLYFCVHQDKTGRIILPYRVNVVGLNPNVNDRLRNIREAEVYDTNDNTVSDSHFVAAVTSSVIVTFLVAFTLGAFGRSYVIKCVQMTRAHLPCRKGQPNNEPTSNNTQAVHFATVFFHKKQNTGEDFVDIVENQVKEDLVDPESEKDANVRGNETADGEKDRTNQPQSAEEQSQEFKTVLSPHPKKKTRVIKVYNYDEEGNQYGHIKESGVEIEDEVRPRTKSLTRLNAIMKQAESTDFNAVKESTDSQSATFSETNTLTTG